MSTDEVTTEQPTSNGLMLVSDADKLYTADVNEEHIFLEPTVACAAGLSFLKDIDQLHVKERQDYREGFSGYDYKNTFIVTDRKGLKLLVAKEETNFCKRNCCGSFRSFCMVIRTLAGFQALTLERPLRCHRCCFPCCLQEMNVFDSSGECIGFIEQRWNAIRPNFIIKNPAEETALSIVGHYCYFPLCTKIEYEVFSGDGEKIGSIQKPYRGCLEEAFADPYRFIINFPVELEPNMKAMLLAAYFLIDYTYYEW